MIASFHTVQHLVESSVPREDDERIGVAGLTCQFDGMPRTLRSDRAYVPGAHQSPLDGRDALLGDAARFGVDDQDRAFHGTSMPRSTKAALGRRVAAHTVEQERVEAICQLIRVGFRSQPGVRPVRG